MFSRRSYFVIDIPSFFCRLGDTLNVFLDGNGFPPVENLPDTIELAKIVSTWDYVVHYQRKKGGHRIET